MQNCRLWICKTNMFNSASKTLRGIDFMQKYNMIILPRFEKFQRKLVQNSLFPFKYISLDVIISQTRLAV